MCVCVGGGEEAPAQTLGEIIIIYLEGKETIYFLLTYAHFLSACP